MGEVCHANVSWMIHILVSDADDHIKLSMWLRALTAQTQCNYQEHALPLSYNSPEPPTGAHYAKNRETPSLSFLCRYTKKVEVTIEFLDLRIKKRFEYDSNQPNTKLRENER